MYQGSEQHKENYKRAAALGALAQSALRNQRKQDYYSNPKLCLGCSAPIPYEKKRENSFCQKSCSASFNNRARGGHSLETKQRIGIATKNAIAILVSKRIRKKSVLIEKVCKACPEMFKVKASKKSQVFCSKDCQFTFFKTDEGSLEMARQNGRIAVEKQMLAGKWKGWSGQGENVRSYPERFVEEQLVLAGIEYGFQKQMGRFKLDFSFEEKRIALEVDGKQHEYPKQKESDQRKDAFLNKMGWTVFRIKWKSVKTEQGRREVQDQIDLVLGAVLA